jgi:predicted SAM-dependent methyltransferase
MLGSAGIPNNASILDVGAGNGAFLFALRGIGFGRLLGIDPYIDADLHYAGDVQIRKIGLETLKEEGWDLITLHHALEHMVDQIETLHRCAELLGPNGQILVRVPTVSSEAWKRYGSDWVQLDAPRHLVLHSRKSLVLAARQAGLHVERIVDDSTALQFWGSEQYRRDIPLNDLRSYGMNRGETIFSLFQIECWEKESQRLNHIGQGDQIAAWLKRI